MSWEAGLAVDHFEIMETGATEATSRVISSTEAAAGEAWVENLKSFTEYTITIYNGNLCRRIIRKRQKRFWISHRLLPSLVWKSNLPSVI